VKLTYFFFIHTHATGYYDPAVFIQGLTDGIQGFSAGTVNKTTGIDHNDVRAVIAG
jgi:hypothetical protein